MLTASFCIQYSKFYSLPNLTMFESSNRYIHVTVHNVQIHIQFHPIRKDYAIQRSQKLVDSKRRTCKFLDAHCILCIEHSLFYIKLIMTSLQSIHAVISNDSRPLA